MLHYWHSKSLPKPERNVLLVYIVSDANYDSRNVSIMFPNVSMTVPVVLVSFMGLYNH